MIIVINPRMHPIRTFLYFFFILKNGNGDGGHTDFFQTDDVDYTDGLQISDGELRIY